MKFKQIIESSFFDLKGNTSISNLKKAVEFFKKNPGGFIKTGIWDEFDIREYYEI